MNIYRGWIVAFLTLWLAGVGHAAPLRIACTSTLLTALMDVAKQRDLFTQQGVAVAMEEADTSETAMQALIRHEADLATVSDLSLALHGFAHRDLRVIATLGVSWDEFKIIARADRKITGPQSLQGKIVATLPRSPAALYFRDQFQLKHDVLLTVPASPPESVEALVHALTHGTIDAFVGREPFLSDARKQLANKFILLSEPGLYERSFSLVTRQAILDQSPVAIRQILTTLLQTQKQLQDPHANFLQQVSDNTGIPLQRLSNDLMATRLGLFLDQELLLTMEHQAKWARRQGLIPTASVPNFLHLLSPAPLAQVAPLMVNLYR